MKKLSWMNTKASFIQILMIVASWFLWKKQILAGRNLPADLHIYIFFKAQIDCPVETMLLWTRQISDSTDKTF